MATVTPQYPCDIEGNTNAIYEALQAPDEDGVINILLSLSNEQRQQVASSFEETFGQNIYEQYKSQLSVDIASTCGALTVAPGVYASKEIKHIFEQEGDECTLIEIISARSKNEMYEISDAYGKDTGRSLVQDLQRDGRLSFENLLVTDASGKRHESKDVDSDLARAEAQSLFEAGEGVWGTGECGFMQLLIQRSLNQLKRTFMEYESLAGSPIEDAIRENMDPSYLNGCVGFTTFIKDSLEYFADRLYYSLRGSCTDESTLRRVIIYRSEIDMSYVKGTFEQKYQEPLRDFIENEAQSDFKKILLRLVGE